MDAVDSVFMELPVINMLVAFIIYDLNSAPIRNPHPLGNAWFVPDFKIGKEMPLTEILAMKNFNPSETAIVDQRFISHIHEVNLTKRPAEKLN